MSYDVGDLEENVLKNLVKAVMNMPGMFSVRQVHGNSVRIFSQQDKSDLEEHEGDALITDVPGYLLLVKGADCQSVIIFDPVQTVVANIHAGWRGSIQNIIGRTVSVMKEVYGCRPQDLICGIGPSLGPCCAEFVNHAQEFPPAFKRYEVSLNHFDFWAISREQLEVCGVCPENIAISTIYTRCNTDQFFSYRKEKVTGRFGTVIGLRP
jgi:YfiH family protein